MIFLRRIIALFYDFLLVLGLCIVATLPLLILTKGEAIAPQHFGYQLLLFLLIFSFFVGFWTFGGQTTGMRAWRLKVVSEEGQSLSIKQAILRFFLALFSQSLFALGFFWCLIDKDKKTLFDRLVGTKMVLLDDRE